MQSDFRSAPTPVAMNLLATHHETEGWDLLVHVAVPGVHSTISDRIRYRGLTNSELLDVVEATARKHLGLL